MNQLYFDRLLKELKKNDIDAMLIAPSDELRFILGNTPDLCERFQGLFIKENGDSFYICNLLTAGEMKTYLNEEVQLYEWFDGDEYIDVVEKALNDYQLVGKTIAVNSTAQACRILEIAEKFELKLIPGNQILEEIRIIKTEKEIESLKQSSCIADKVFEDLLNYIRPGIKEVDIRNYFVQLFLKHGGEYASSVVAFGANSSYPHYMGTQAVIQEKDIVLLDFGGYYNGMRSDITRTIFVGDITDKQKEIYRIVLNANEAGIKAAFSGAFIPDIDKAARDIICKEGYGEYFTTRLGHGIGYMGHEAPDIKQSNKRYLEKGMAFTIEPGIYLTGCFGIRIEDVVVITDKGTEVLNNVTKDIVVL
ncbi:MAG: Xaa-Pro peptidase family protein [Firmicutes bacterium]|nr:Xaa-Pro peptidase family protein [Bacillota bacterium]